MVGVTNPRWKIEPCEEQNRKIKVKEPPICTDTGVNCSDSTSECLFLLLGCFCSVAVSSERREADRRNSNWGRICNGKVNKCRVVHVNVPWMRALFERDHFFQGV